MTERMGVLSSDGRCLQPSPLAARAMLRPAARRLAAVGIGFAGGWAVLYGALMPFGLGLTLGLAEDCFAPCAAGAALGLLLHGLGALSLRSLCQLCALGAAVAARWLLPQKFVPAALAGCGTLTGMALCFALGSSGGADLLLYSAADALLAAGIGFGLRRFAPERPGMGTLLVGAAVAGALGSVRWGWFSPGVLACAAAELALCCRAQKFAALSGSAVLGGSSLRRRPRPCPGGSGAWLCHGSGGGAGTRAAGGDPCRLRGRVRIRSTLRTAARKRFWAVVQRLRRYGGGLSAARRLACPGGRHPAERGKHPRARPQCGGVHPAGSRGAEPFLTGRNGERGLRGLAPAAGGFPLGHRQCT